MPLRFTPHDDEGGAPPPRAPLTPPPIPSVDRGDDDPESRELGHTRLIGRGASIPFVDRVMPRVAGGVAWGLVALVALILGILFVNGLPGISWNYLTGDLSRGSFFTGATRIVLTLERDPSADGEADAPLLRFDVTSREGEVVDADLIAFEKSSERASVVVATNDGTDAASVTSTDSRATISAGGERATIAWDVPMDRETGGGRWTISLGGDPLPGEVERLELQFLVESPLLLAGLAEAVTSRGDSSSAPASIFEVPATGWRVAPDVPIAATRIDGSGLLPMIYGTFLVTLLMTVLCVPFGVLSALYLHEYARRDALHTRIIRGAINNLAGVPSIVFGLFGLGFFIAYVGPAIDHVFFGGEKVYAQACVLWASCTLAVLTLPVVIVSTEEALRAIPQGLRDASLALGGTRWQTVWRVVVPEAMPGILTGMILAVGRGAGEVAPILFTGVATSSPDLPSLWGNEKFMHLGNHVYVLATQSPDVERTRSLLFATVIVLLGLTFLLNLAAIMLRIKLDKSGSRGAH